MVRFSLSEMKSKRQSMMGNKPKKSKPTSSSSPTSFLSQNESNLKKERANAPGGIAPFKPNAPGGGSSNVYDNLGATQYNKALNVMSPVELQNQFQKAQSYGRGVDVGKFMKNMDRYEAFQQAGGQPFKFEGQTYGNVQMPMMTANAPTTAQFFGDMAGGLSNLLGAAGEFVMGGGALGNIIDATKQKFSQGKDFVQNITNPGDINQRVANLTPEQRRTYFMYLNQNMPYQRAFELASGGQKFAMGGIANLN